MTIKVARKTFNVTLNAKRALVIAYRCAQVNNSDEIMLNALIHAIKSLNIVIKQLCFIVPNADLRLTDLEKMVVFTDRSSWKLKCLPEPDFIDNKSLAAGETNEK